MRRPDEKAAVLEVPVQVQGIHRHDEVTEDEPGILRERLDQGPGPSGARALTEDHRRRWLQGRDRLQRRRHGGRQAIAGVHTVQGGHPTDEPAPLRGGLVIGEQLGINAVLSEVVDDDRGLSERRIVGPLAEQRGLAGAEEAAEGGDGGRTHASTYPRP